MRFGILYPWVLLLLLLALIPFFFYGQNTVRYSSLILIPTDRLSNLLSILLRVITAVTIGLLVLGISGPFRAAQVVERTGQGAQMVLLLDRSRSMDEPFAGQAFRHPLASAGYDSKGKVARRLLSEFAARRQSDLFSLLAFSTQPIQILPFTGKPEIIQAAIAAGNIGRGLSKTDVGAGLESALAVFENLPYRGSRIILLVSDGAATLDLETRTRIKNLLRRHRVALYWIYIRSRNSPGIFGNSGDELTPEIAPERALHAFFQRMGTPYRAYTADNPETLERAIADVNRLQNLPIRYTDLIPRRDLSGYCYAIALFLLGLLVIVKFFEVRVWRQLHGN